MSENFLASYPIHSACKPPVTITPPPQNAIEDNIFQLFYITSAHPFNRCLFVSPPTSPPIGPFAGRSTSGGLPAFGPRELSFGLFIVGGL
jgi:hypothetical protein